MKDLRQEYRQMISQQKAKFAPCRKGKKINTKRSTILRDISPRLKAYEPVRSASSVSQSHGALASRGLNDSNF